MDKNVPRCWSIPPATKNVAFMAWRVKYRIMTRLYFTQIISDEG